MHRLDLARLARFDVRTWYAAFGLAALMVALQLLGTVARESLPYERSAIVAGGEYARLLSAHFYHYDFAHLAWNLAGLVLVAWLFAAEFSARGWGLILLVSTAAVDVGFLVLEPRLEWYVGFSGVLHGLAAAGLAAWLLRTRDSITAIVATIFAAKLAWEHFAGPLPFAAQSLPIPVIHEAHTYGAVGGLLAGSALCLRQRRRVASL